MITLRQIEAFKAVMETGMVVKAAGAMHLSQPAVSRLLGDLETEFGYRLFERRKGKLVARREATELYVEVERSFSGLRRIQAAAERIGRNQLNHLRIVALSALSMGPVPRVTTGFLADNPSAHLSVQIRPRHQVLEGVADRHYDLGLGTLPVDHEEVETVLVEAVPFHCIVPRDHPLAQRDSITLQDLDGVCYVAVVGEGPLELRRRINGLFFDNGIKREIRFECSAMVMACALAAEGLGVALAPGICINDLMYAHLRVLPFKPEITVDIAVFHPRSRPPSELGWRFIEAFGAALRCDGAQRPKRRIELPSQGRRGAAAAAPH